MKWIIKFYHTESMYKAGIVSFTQTKIDEEEKENEMFNENR